MKKLKKKSFSHLLANYKNSMPENLKSMIKIIFSNLCTGLKENDKKVVYLIIQWKELKLCINEDLQSSLPGVETLEQLLHFLLKTNLQSYFEFKSTHQHFIGQIFLLR